MLVDAVDISKEILSFAEKGIYAPDTSQMVNASIFERLTEAEKAEMFDWEGDQAKVKSWLREGITWQLGDAADPALINTLRPQDMVVASNFLCHMAPADAEKCLGNIARLVNAGGYLFVSGVDLDVRTKIALDLGWEPARELMTEIHDGNPSVRAPIGPGSGGGLSLSTEGDTIGKPVMLRCSGLPVRNATDLNSSAMVRTNRKIQCNAPVF